MADKGNSKPTNVQRIATKKGASTPMISHGLYADPSRWDLDGRTTLAKNLGQLRAGLGGLFPDGPDRAASLLIYRIVFKNLNLALYEATIINGLAEATATGEQKYLQMSGSFRADLQLLISMAKAQAPNQSDPDLMEYIETLKKAAKAQAVKFVEVERS
jgi:hypothetical protein